MKGFTVFFQLIIILSCSIVDFSPEEGITTNPSKENQIIDENEIIYVSFDFSPDKISAESLFQITDYLGKINGSFSWNSRRMLFTPDEKMVRGRRYTFDYSGTVSRKDGGEVKSEIVIPFFYKTAFCNIPYLTSVSPSAGKVITQDNTLVFTFSKQMDEASVKKGFKINPDTEYVSVWNTGSTELTVAPKDKWKNLSSYTFSLADSICCSENIPIETEYNYTYYCDSSHVKPEVISVFTVLNDISHSWPRVSDNLDTIKYKEGVEIEFSLNMDKESAENSFSITPYIPGRSFWKDEKTFIFIPDNGWQCNLNYTLKISGTAKSENNIASGSVYTVSFKPDINEIILSSIDGKASDGFPVSSYSTVLDIDTGEATPYEYSFTCKFSEPFSTETEKEKLQNNINISALFPPDASSPFPVSYTWIGDNSVTVKYSGFTAYDSGRNVYYYYMLSLNGGPSGISNNRGSFLKEDIKQILRTK